MRAAESLMVVNPLNEPQMETTTIKRKASAVAAIIGAAIVKRRNKLLRALAIAAALVVLVPISWPLLRFGTLGVAAVHYAISPQYPSLGEGLKIAAITDFAVYFAGIWGLWELWARSREENRKPSNAGNQLDRAASIGTVAYAILCAIPMSYYPVLGAAILFNGRRLPEHLSTFSLEMALSLTACSATIVALYSLIFRSGRVFKSRK
jgi:hypothetical protein